jgi:phenylalanyl-tRNA synthetase alpha chain
MGAKKKLIFSLHPLERKVLPAVLKGDSLNSISQNANLAETETRKAILMLEQRNLLSTQEKEEKKIVLDKFGQKFAKTNLPEITFLEKLLDGKKTLKEIGLSQEEFSSAIGILKRNNLVEITKDGNEMIFSPTSNSKKYLLLNLENPLKEFSQDVLVSDLTKKQKEIIDNFKMRKGFLKESSEKSLTIILTSQGEKIAKEIESKYSDLDLVEAVDTAMLKNRTWKGKEFRHYDVNVEVPTPEIGRRHPMLEANNILKEVFVEMGFKEMEGPMVESAFWNMDVMWIPQDHPARDEQDTFYLEGKAKVPTSAMKKVKDMHEKGIKRTHTSVGDWSEDITCKRLLRTHSTSTSFRTLYELGKKLAKGEDVNEF